MRFVPVSKPHDRYPAFRTICFKCGVGLQTDRDFPSVWADLDGPAFRAYYCGTCVNQIAGPSKEEER
jgi:hypothetical protein